MPTILSDTRSDNSARLSVRSEGSGPQIVFVHGSVLDGAATWSAQQVLTDSWTCVIPDRPGFGASPAVGPTDFEAEAPAIAALLNDGAHLVGHSYGGIVAMFAAARRPSAVRSLTLIEPPAFSAVRGSARLDKLVERLRAHLAVASPTTDAEFLAGFVHITTGRRPTLPAELEPALRQGVRRLRDERPPWEAQLPLEQLASAQYPKLVISGDRAGWSAEICAALVSALGARWITLTGGHNLQRTNRQFNRTLRVALDDAELGLGQERGVHDGR